MLRKISTGYILFNKKNTWNLEPSWYIGEDISKVMGSFEVANATWRWERNPIQHHLPMLWPIAGRCDLGIDKRLGGCAFPERVQICQIVLIIPNLPKYLTLAKKWPNSDSLPFPSCSILFRLEDQAQGFSLALQIHKLHYLEMWAPPCFGTPTQRHLRSLRQTGGSAPDFTSRLSATKMFVADGSPTHCQASVGDGNPGGVIYALELVHSKVPNVSQMNH